VTIQGLKAMVDCVAITSGIDYRLLRHRARPVTVEEEGRWHEVWTQLHMAELSPAAIIRD